MALISKPQEKKRIGELLIEAGLLTKDSLDSLIDEQKTSGLRLGEFLVEKNIITEQKLLEALAKQTKYQIINLDAVRPTYESTTHIKDADVLKKACAIPFNFKDDKLYVAINDPSNAIGMEDIRIVADCPVKFFLATKKSIMMNIDRYYGSTAQQNIVKQYSMERKAAKQEKEEVETEEDTTESSIVKLVNNIIEQAAHFRASDIHIEALEEEVRVRYRIDGDLKEFATYPISMLGPLVSRLKIIGGMDISEKRKPQDGRITYMVDGTEFDIRVSILPTVYGEKTVMRLAEKKQLKRDKKLLGFNPDDLEKFDSIISNPHGIILVTGPTGSGKSTTLYTALSELNKEKVNIITVEDPVEANINGINQVQVNNKADMTFANALRSILRQDPDIIMIGEIRDQETANIAVEASITGHLVVSTLHTNSAVSTISRMQNMGVESYLLADATVGIIAQRLVKRLCTKCRKKVLATPEEKRKLKISGDTEIELFKPCGCTNCNDTGYNGRIGVYEILPITRRIRNAIAAEKPMEEIEKLAIEEGMQTLGMSARKLVLKGITDISEMERIVHEET